MQADSLIRTIVVPTLGLPADDLLLQGAASVARMFTAHLVVIHVHVSEKDLVLSLAAPDPAGAAALGPLIMDLMRNADTRQAAAKQAYDRLGQVGGASTEWRPLVGRHAECFVEEGRAADLMVVGRIPGTGEVPLDVVERVLMDLGKPMLLLPTSPLPELSGTVVVAWKNTREAARALMGAMPFIARAERVLVINVAEADDAVDHSAARVVDGLRRHNAATQLLQIPRQAGTHPADTLVQTAQRHQAGLLIFGAYSHSRLREVVFGGVTRALLRSAPLPLLVVH